MSDPDSKSKGGVPSWQKQQSQSTEEKALPDESQSAPATTEPATTEPATSESSSRASIIENARKFLEDEEVKDATTDKKITFLESKGLDSDEIHELLGISRNAEASNPQPPISTAQPGAQPPFQPQPSQVAPPPPTPHQSQPQAPSPTPPIITYPEFLTTPSSPPPLVTSSLLLKTLYLFGSLSTVLYGTTTFLIKPMSEALAASRHELLSQTTTNLETLNSKLSSMVSEVPKSLLQDQAKEHEEKDEDSEDEDPTELFHRDIGIQTSLPTSPVASRPSSPPPSTLQKQKSRLEKLASNIGALNTEHASLGDEQESLSGTIDALREYLEGLVYSPPAYSYGGYGGAKRDEADDEISRVKREIRAVKGVLLTARSFPGVGAGAR